MPPRNILIRYVIIGIIAGVIPGMMGYYAFEHWQFWPLALAINFVGNLLMEAIDD
jgi:uncharacterized membrane protein YoaK (UPF0700 family)